MLGTVLNDLHKLTYFSNPAIGTVINLIIPNSSILLGTIIPVI